LINDTFFKNQSAGHGGALALALTNNGGGNGAFLTSLTVYKNTAAVDSGGVYVNATDPGVVNLDNNIFDQNIVTAADYTGELDFLAVNFASVSHAGYNLVGTSNNNNNSVFGAKGKNDILNDSAGLEDTLANNGALPGYPQTLKMSTQSIGYQKGDQNLVDLPNPNNIDAGGLTRVSELLNGQWLAVSIGAMDPDAQYPV
jgi:hypothetical protein